MPTFVVDEPEATHALRIQLEGTRQRLGCLPSSLYPEICYPSELSLLPPSSLNDNRLTVSFFFYFFFLLVPSSASPPLVLPAPFPAPTVPPSASPAPSTELEEEMMTNAVIEGHHPDQVVATLQHKAEEGLVFRTTGNHRVLHLDWQALCLLYLVHSILICLGSRETLATPSWRPAAPPKARLAPTMASKRSTTLNSGRSRCSTATG